MPRIGRGNPDRRLRMGWRMLNVIACAATDRNLGDGEADSIARMVAFPGVRRAGHEHADVASRGPRTADRDPRIPGVAVVHIGNRNPRAVYRIVDRVFARPILNRIREREWLRPGDLHEVDNARPSQIDEHPLRTIAEVRIAFPEGGGIAV